MTADVQSHLGQNKREGRTTSSICADVISIRVLLRGFAREWKPSTDLLEAAEAQRLRQCSPPQLITAEQLRGFSFALVIVISI